MHGDTQEQKRQQNLKRGKLQRVAGIHQDTEIVHKSRLCAHRAVAVPASAFRHSARHSPFVSFFAGSPSYSSPICRNTPQSSVPPHFYSSSSSRLKEKSFLRQDTKDVEEQRLRPNRIEGGESNRSALGSKPRGAQTRALPPVRCRSVAQRPSPPLQASNRSLGEKHVH